MDTYVGPLDSIVHDAGTQFTSAEFVQNAKSIGNVIKYVLIKAHHSISIVERYYTPLCQAFEIITKELPRVSKQFVLQMAIKAVNNTAGPDGLVPTLLVFGTYPWIATTDTPSLTVTKRGKAITKAMKQIAELHARRQVTDALRQRNRPNISNTLDVLIGGNVLVYREDKG
jgi:hypothetical protein